MSGFAQLFVPDLLATFSGVMIGLLVSAISPSEERAMLLIIAVIIPQFLLSGALVPINALGGAGPLTAPATAKWSWGRYAAPPRNQDWRLLYGLGRPAARAQR